jgi:hypothetical protein
VALNVGYEVSFRTVCLAVVAAEVADPREVEDVANVVSGGPGRRAAVKPEDVKR